MAVTPSTREHWIRRVLIGIAIVATLFVAGSWHFAYRLTGSRHRAVGSPPQDFSFTIEAVSWTTSDVQTIKGWFIPGVDSERAIILLHGFAGDRRSMLARARAFRAAGYSILAYDARACGESSGDMVTFGYHERNDLLGALDHLRDRGFRRIACLGVSQGGATILMSADKLHDVRCVICESVFDELAHAVDNRFRHYTLLPSCLGGCLMVPIAERRTGIALADVNPVEHIGRLPCPIYVISGANDVKTLPSETRRLFEAAREPKELWMVENAGHHDLFNTEYVNKVLAFLNKHMDR